MKKMKFATLSLLLLIFLTSIGCGNPRAEGLNNPSEGSASSDNVSAAKEVGCSIMDKILESRDPITYTKELTEALEAITLKTDTLPVGSFKFKAQKYPGDIDIFEAVAVTMPKEKAKAYYAARLASVAERVAADPDIFLGDFKAGIDTKVKLDVGKATEHREFAGYDQAKVQQSLQNMKEQNLITQEEFDNLTGLAKKDLSFDDWANLKESARQISTLRWNLEELMKQEKVLRDGSILKLGDALEGTVVKIDVHAPVTRTSGYTEVTNFYNLQYKDQGETHSLTEEMPNYAKSIEKDVITFFDKNTRKLLKGAKRLWVLSTILDDNELTAKLIPITRSPAAGLNQIIAESEVVRAISQPEKKIECVPVGARLMKQMESFEKRIAHHGSEIPVTLLSNKDNGLIRQIFDSYQQDCPLDAPYLGQNVVSDKTKTLINENLNKLEELIKPVVEKHAEEFLTNIGINLDDPLSALTGNKDVCPLKVPVIEDNP
jgi:hypothetical protein